MDSSEGRLGCWRGNDNDDRLLHGFGSSGSSSHGRRVEKGGAACVAADGHGFGLLMIEGVEGR